MLLLDHEDESAYTPTMYASQLREQVDEARLVEELSHQPMKRCGQTGRVPPSSSTAILVACLRRQRPRYTIGIASESTVASLPKFQ